jgi:hypothetical protein
MLPPKLDSSHIRLPKAGKVPADADVLLAECPVIHTLRARDRSGKSADWLESTMTAYILGLMAGELTAAMPPTVRPGKRTDD